MNSVRSISNWLFLIIVINVVLLFPDRGLTLEDSTKVFSGGVPVVFKDDTLFYVFSGIETFPPADRAKIIERRLESFYEKKLSDFKIQITDTIGISQVILDSTVIVNITDNDAGAVGITRLEMAQRYAESIKKSLESLQSTNLKRNRVIELIITLSMFLAAAILFWLSMKIFPWLYDKLESWEGKILKPVKLRSLVIISAENITSMFLIMAKSIRFFLTLLVTYLLTNRLLDSIPWTRNWDAKPIVKGFLLSVLVSVIFMVMLRWINSIFAFLIKTIPKWKGTLIKPVRLKTVVILSEDRLIEILSLVARLPRYILSIILIYFYITIIFSFFEFSQTWAATLVSYFLKPLNVVFQSFISFLPNFFFILVIIFITRFVLKFIRLIFIEIEKGKLELPGFFSDWARPTYKIIRFLIIAFAVIVVFPYLPGSDSPFFKGISIFLGVLFSLGSTSAIANIISGIVLTYMRPFKIGDRVKIADTVGDVMEKTLLVTRIRTIKNVDITITNSMILGSHMINYSSSARNRGLILHTTVTIGYDAPWRKVHELLIAAALTTENIISDPSPFVLQTSLNDFYVAYELNAYTNEPGRMAFTYSQLHQNIQDKFNEAGIEIMSPHYEALRDGNKAAIPADQLPTDYKAPGFRFEKPGPID